MNFVSRCSLLLMILLLVSQSVAVMEGAKVASFPPYKTPLSLQQMQGGYWRIDHTFAPTLHITNFLENVDLPVTPVLYMADGTEYDLPPVVLDRSGVMEVDILQALREAPPAIISCNYS